MLEESGSTCWTGFGVVGVIRYKKRGVVNPSVHDNGRTVA